MPQFSKTGFEDVATDVLRNLWLIKFGGHVMTADALQSFRNDDIFNIGRELLDRKQIRYETNYSADTTDIQS